MSEPYWIYDDNGHKFCRCQHLDGGIVILETKSSRIPLQKLMCQVIAPETTANKRNKKYTREKVAAS